MTSKMHRVQFFIRPILLIVIALFSVAGKTQERVTYLILAETVEPIMIVRDGNPMAGGIMTEIVELMFRDSDYLIEPLVLPWQRMEMEFKNRDDWILHGFPESFGPDVPLEMSKRPIFPFNHVAVTLKGSAPPVRTLGDLNNRNVILVENFQYPKLDDYLHSAASATVESNVGVVRAFTPAGSLRMLKHKRGDVVIDWEARIIYNLASAGLEFGDIEIHDATQIVPTRNIHLAFSSRQSDKFRNFVNTRIDELTQSGQLYELVDRYYQPASPPRDFFSTDKNQAAAVK
ncbi:MAG: hypothetical protein V7742_19880 [Halioglobus sp.]